MDKKVVHFQMSIPLMGLLRWLSVKRICLSMQEMLIQSLGCWEDPLLEEMETHSNILAWRIPWSEEPGGLQSLGSQRVRYA